MLASSLNVELVYVILKSITQFAYINREDLDSNRSFNIGKNMKKIDFDWVTEDATMRLNRIKVKNIADWETLGTQS